eukprot:12233084-Alexandrium_andersonii.AAC.1
MIARRCESDVTRTARHIAVQTCSPFLACLLTLRVLPVSSRHENTAESIPQRERPRVASSAGHPYHVGHQR